jgi:hypothetical protein
MESTADPVVSISKRIFIWMVIGALVPMFWGVMSFIFFTARESHWTDLYWNVVYVTCPAWLSPESKWSMLITPLANTVLYGLIAFLVSIALRGLSSRTARTR